VSFRRPDKLIVNVHENDGSKERQTIMVDPKMRVKTGDSDMKLSELPRNYTLNFAIPSDRFEMANNEEIIATEEVAVIEELPKTASIWPTLGLAGFTMLMFSQLLTWRRKKA
jgi:LPXTG-motif cell wall-anchored protein